MGYSTYSHVNYSKTASDFVGKTTEQIFTSTSIKQTMNPKNISVRECRDSENHPNTLPIIIGLDVTGSMGYIPANLIKRGLGTIMHTIINEGIADPAVCFVAIGDQYSDSAPLQVGQFESGDQELIHWLKDTWIERGGGGSAEESYQLAWYFAQNYVEADNWEKRKKKGIIITIGDEGFHATLGNFNHIFGSLQAEKMNTKELYEKVSEKWDIYHIHANDGSYNIQTPIGQRIINSWKDLLGQRVYIIDHHTDIPNKIAQIIKEHEADVKVKKDEDSTSDKPHML